MPAIGLPHFLLVGVALFALGLYTVVTRRNAVGVLMGVELLLNAAALNFVAFEHFRPTRVLTGQAYALFIIVLAAAEAAVALAIVLALSRTAQSIDVSRATELRE